MRIAPLLLLLLAGCLAGRVALGQDAALDQCLRGSPDQMIDNCTRALNDRLSADQRLSAYMTRAAVFAATKDYPAAIRDYGEALKVRPGFGPALGGRCLANLGRDDKPRALADCNEAVRVQPNDPTALTARGIVFIKNNDLRRAETDFTAALVRDQNFALALWGRGYVEVQTGRPDDGRRKITAARRLEGGIDAEAARFGVVVRDR